MSSGYFYIRPLYDNANEQCWFNDRQARDDRAQNLGLYDKRYSYESYIQSGNTRRTGTYYCVPALMSLCHMVSLNNARFGDNSYWDHSWYDS